jgi:hypothetical protein
MWRFGLGGIVIRGARIQFEPVAHLLSFEGAGMAARSDRIAGEPVCRNVSKRRAR